MKEPIGVVGCNFLSPAIACNDGAIWLLVYDSGITPWNYPLNQIAGHSTDLAFFLLAIVFGCE